MNLTKRIQSEVARCRELKKLYDKIPVTAAGARMIQATIDGAENAVAHGDVLEMLKWHQELKEIA